jgi:hypothetical protein
MKDLQNAMLEEQRYLADKFRGIDTSLSARLAPYGYTTLKEYFTNKQEYLFNQIQFNFVEEPMPNGVSEIFKMINTNKPGLLFVDWEDTYVVCGEQGLNDFNQDYCNTHNVTFFPLYTKGGTIVGSKGDFSLGICYPSYIAPSEDDYIIKKIAALLQKYTTEIVSVAGNDILINNEKICGSANYTQNDVTMVIMHFSFTDWTELIANICNKQSSKPVNYVYFMTRD